MIFLYGRVHCRVNKPYGHQPRTLERNVYFHFSFSCLAIHMFIHIKIENGKVERRRELNSVVRHILCAVHEMEYIARLGPFEIEITCSFLASNSEYDNVFTFASVSIGVSSTFFVEFKDFTASSFSTQNPVSDLYLCSHTVSMQIESIKFILMFKLTCKLLVF